MSREQSFNAIVIKKQPLGEADEIITLFAEDIGKVRAVAKSTKLTTSKLQHALQPTFVIQCAVAGKTSLPKLIRASITQSFPNLIANYDCIAGWFVAAELLIKLLPDNEPNAELYSETLLLLNFLNSIQANNKQKLDLGILKYKLCAMQSSGLGIHSVGQLESDKTLLFSVAKGGFYYKIATPTSSGLDADSIVVNSSLWVLFESLIATNYENLVVDNPNLVQQLEKLVNNFISYQLDRELKADQYYQNLS